jgi:aldose 1-epimerase
MKLNPFIWGGLLTVSLTTTSCSTQSHQDKVPPASASPATSAPFTAQLDESVKIGGAGVVRLRRAQQGVDRAQFVEAALLPGRGMNTFELQAFLPGRGLVSVFATLPLNEAAQLFSAEDPYGNLSFKYGGALLVPFANRIRGKLDPKTKTIHTKIAGKMLDLPANWKGQKTGAEPHAMHGLILNSRADVTALNGGEREATVDALLNAGNFAGHWPSKMDVKFHVALREQTFVLQIEAKNVGTEPAPLGIGWHPYFNFPSGDRKQAQLMIPARQRALVNNYDDVFPTGKIEKVHGTPYDFSSATALKETFLDDCFLDVTTQKGQALTAEIIDPAAKYGLKIRALSPEIKAFQVYAPIDKSFVALEPQFNIGDPYSGVWHKGGHTQPNGMLTLQPGQSATYSVELELFTP